MNDEQNEKISEYERQILEIEGRKKKECKISVQIKTNPDNLKNSTSNTMLVLVSID